MERIRILGIEIDSLSQQQAISRLKQLLAGSTQHHVMTPNNEMLVRASHDLSFRSVLHNSSLNLPDSTGLVWAARMTRQALPERVTGVDTVTRLCGELGQEYPVFLLGAREGVGRRASDALIRMNPRLNIVGVHAGSPSDDDVASIVSMVNEARPRLLLVAYGAPGQDLWIDKHLKHMPSVRVAMGVGGTFDFLAGTVWRAPTLLRSLGLEWLWRLTLQPWRVGRIWTAAVTFPRLVGKFGKDAPE